MIRSMMRTRHGVFLWFFGVPAAIAVPVTGVFLALLGVRWPYALSVAGVASALMLVWGAWYFFLGPLRSWRPTALTKEQLDDPTRKAKVKEVQRGVGLRSIVIWASVTPVLFLLFWLVNMPLVVYLFFGAGAAIGLVSGVWLITRGMPDVTEERT